MLNRVKINDFRALHRVDVPLKPFTVLIGKNNTGKTSLLAALELLATVSSEVKREFRISDADFWRLQRKCSPAIVGSATGVPDVQVKRQTDVWVRVGSNDQIRPLTFFTFLNSPAMDSVGADERQGIPPIAKDGGNLPAYLDALLRKDRQRFFRILDTLRTLVPGFCDLNIETPKSDRRRIDIEFEEGLIMEGQFASFGVKMMIFFVCLANHPNPPRTVLIEEPETGVHPQRLKDIVDLLVGLTEGKFSSDKIQVIVSTHSPHLLDLVDPEKHQVLVHRRLETGECVVDPLDIQRMEYFLDGFMLGEVWFNQDEGNLVKKD
jgi:predicted ATPase